MKLTLTIPVLNQLNDAKGILKLLRDNTSRETEFLIIDNGSTDNYEEFVYQYLKPAKVNFVRNETNIGLVKTMQQAYELCTTDLLAILHNDVFVYEKDWDQRVISIFENHPKIGAAGFLGAQGCGPNGERIQDVYRQGQGASMSNMLEAEEHGIRLAQNWRYCAIFDGLALIFRMEMLKKAGGFDQRYRYHHYYDRDASLESLRHGYQNVVINVPFHHLSGLTANRGDYQDWVSKVTTEERKTDERTGDKYIHDKNGEYFAEKWKDVLPLYIDDSLVYRSQETHGDAWHQFKGDAITRKT